MYMKDNWTEITVACEILNNHKIEDIQVIFKAKTCFLGQETN